MTSKRLFLFVVLLISSIVSFAFFLQFAQTHNKYLDPQVPRPCIGVYDLRDAAGQPPPLLYLSAGWEFYPQQFLEPQMLDQPGVESRNFDIAKELEFAILNNNNLGTYRLRLLVGQQSTPYAITVPNLHSMYRLWINGTLYIDTALKEPLSTAILTFWGSDEIEIVITTDTEPVLQSGLIRAITFGSPSVLWEHFVLELSLTTAAMIFAILMAFPGFLFRMRIDRLPLNIAQSLLYFYFALCMSRIPLELLFNPSARIRLILLIAHFNMLFLVLFIYALVFQVPNWQKWTAFLFVFILVIFIAALFLLLPRIPQVTPLFIASVKLLPSVICLLIFFWAVQAVWRVTIYREFYLVAAGILCSCFFMIRLIPIYESSSSQQLSWFGVLAHAIIASYGSVSDVFRLDSAKKQYQAREKAAQQIAHLEAQKYQALTREIDRVRRTRHEIRSLLLAMLSNLQRREYQTLEAQISDALGDISIQTYTSNTLINTLFTLLLPQHVLEKIHFDYDFSSVPTHLPLDDVDICSLISNLLENAIEGCQRLPSSDLKTISFVINSQLEFLYLRCSNSCPNDIKKRYGRFITTKSDRELHGFGIPRIREIVKRYSGVLDIHYSASSFEVEICIPISQELL